MGRSTCTQTANCVGKHQDWKEFGGIGIDERIILNEF
jgi:hypothetical protein